MDDTKHKNDIETIISFFKNINAFTKHNFLTKRGSMILNDALELLKIAFVLSEETTNKSYNAYYAIYNIKRVALNQPIISDTNIIDSITFPAIKKSKNFLLLKENLTAFQLEHLNKIAESYDQTHKHTDFVNKFNTDKIITIGRENTQYYSIMDLFDRLNCHKPFLIKPKKLNDKTEHLTYSGLKAYDKLVKTIQYTHNVFNYPDIVDKLDFIVNSEWY